MNIKHYIGLAILIGISISFVILSSTLGYKIYLGINAEDVALAVKISFITILVLSLLLVGTICGFGIYYLAMKTTASTITNTTTKNININERIQEILAELAKKRQRTKTKTRKNGSHGQNEVLAQ